MFRKVTIRLLRSIFLTAFLLLAALFLAGPWALERIIGQQTIVSWFTGDLSERLNRQMLIRDVDLSFWKGVELRDVQISERSTFQEGTFLKADRFVLKPDLLPLLIGYVRVDELRLEGATIYLVRDSSGAWNLSDLLVSSQKNPKSLALEGPSPVSDVPFTLDVQEFRVTDSRFILKDAQGKIPEFEAKSISIEIDDFSLDSPFGASVRFNLDPSTSIAPAWGAWLKPPLDIRMEGKFNLGAGNPERMTAAFKHLGIESKFWTMDSTATLRSLVPFEGRITSRFHFDQYRVQVGPYPLAFDGDASLRLRLNRRQMPAASLVVSGFSTEAPVASTATFDILLRADQMHASWGPVLEKPPDVFFKMQSNGIWEGRSGKDLPLVPNSRLYQGSMDLRVSSAPPVLFERWEALWKGPVKATSAPASFQIAADTSSISSQAFLTIFSPMRQWSAREGGFKWDRAQYKGSGGKWTVEVRGGQVHQKGLQRKKEKVGSLDVGLEQLLFTGIPGQPVRADFKGALEMKDAGTRFLVCQEMLAVADMKGISVLSESSINGEVHATLNSGALQEIPVLVQYAPFLKFMIKPLTIIEDLDYWGILRLENHDFRALTMDVLQADYYFGESKMSMEKVKLKGPIGFLEVRGSIDFPKNTINVVTTVNVPRGKTPFGMADAFSDAKGNPLFSIKIKGALHNPEVYTIPANKKDMLNINWDDQFKDLKGKVKKVWAKLFR